VGAAPYLRMPRRRMNARDPVERVGLQAAVADLLGDLEGPHEMLEGANVVPHVVVGPAQRLVDFAHRAARLAGLEDRERLGGLRQRPSPFPEHAVAVGQKSECGREPQLVPLAISVGLGREVEGLLGQSAQALVVEVSKCPRLRDQGVDSFASFAMGDAVHLVRSRSVRGWATNVRSGC